jgi:bifunctional non-homologous end joining protein LigD
LTRQLFDRSSPSQPEQLPLHIDALDQRRRLPARLRPMLPQPGDAPFDDPEWFFEPWWPGTSALAYVEDFRVRLQIVHLADPMAAFPELATMGADFANDQLIVEGALLVLDAEGTPDQELLRHRLSVPGSRDGTPAFVASDLLYDLGEPLLDLPFGARRERLSAVLTDTDRCVVSRGIRGEGFTLAEAITSMGLTEVSARLLSARYRPGLRDGSWLRVPVVETPAAVTRPLLTLLQRLPI